MLQLGVISLMPEMFQCLKAGVTGRAIQEQRVSVHYWNPRDWAQGPYRQVDDKPYGGGPGMVMMYEPLHKAINHARQQLPEQCKAIYLSPQGKLVQQKDLQQIVDQRQSLLFIAGRYEGIDERIIQKDIDEEWSVGNFVLSGGEMAAMVFIDAITRLVPGSLGHSGSAADDSHMKGLLDYPHYTRPAEVNGLKVPEVLLKGDHKKIERWRQKQSLGQTWLKRPELLENITLSDKEKALLSEFKQER